MPVQAKRIRFCDIDWEIKAREKMGPGPNRWDTENVALEPDGGLRLRLMERGGVWTCAEVVSVERFGYGSYRWEVTGRIDALDRNVVLGLFNYPTPDVGPDGTNEIDIEFATWGQASREWGNFTVHPAQAEDGSIRSRGYRFGTSLLTDQSTHRFIWSKNRIRFQSQNGYRTDNGGLLTSWEYRPETQENLIPRKAMPVRMNLWLFQGKPPLNRQPVEIVIRRFEYKPL
jgi:hypothetical protein